MNLLNSGLPLEVVQWCNLCNKNPSDGLLTVLDKDGRLMELDACEACVVRIPKSDWVGKDTQ